MKFGPLEKAGWLPRCWANLGYFSPDEWYEALLNKLVAAECRWLDIGCGTAPFPNPALAADLSGRCNFLMGVDPDNTAKQNPYLHELANVSFDSLQTDRKFDLITLRMVAEHIMEPLELVRRLRELLAPDGRVVIYTINKWAPVSLISAATPFRLHHPVKRMIWGTQEDETFPVAYRMNTRKALAEQFSNSGFQEVAFLKLSDCRLFYRFRKLHRLELYGWQICSKVGIVYPENCLLAVYQHA